MAKNYFAKIYLTKAQFERLKNEAEINGMKVSSYARELIFKRNCLHEKMLVEIYDILKNGKHT